MRASQGNRGAVFAFGENWRRFLDRLDERRLDRAAESLQNMLGIGDLAGARFLDVGCGSGLFSLAARRLGATVVSFDADPASVACAEELKRRYASGDPGWIIGQGSVLVEAYLRTLGTFDVVYAWGVLHHTGDLWRSMEQVTLAVGNKGLLFVAIYNDAGPATRRWRLVKKLYNRLPVVLRPLLLVPALVRLWALTVIRDFLKGRPFHTWRHYDDVRGMSPWRDAVDWVGGYPYEVARPREVIDFYAERGFRLRKLLMNEGLGCNEFVFERLPGHSTRTSITSPVESGPTADTRCRPRGSRDSSS